jgi:hypothetical protein
MSPVDRALWFLTAALSAVALGRIFYLGLWRKQPLSSFAFMVLISALCDVAFFGLSNESHAYAVAWEAVLPVRLTSHGWAAFSAYRAVADLYQNLGRFAVWLFAAALSIATLVCCGTLPWELRQIGGNESFIRSMFLLYRWVDGLAAGALILTCGFLAAFPRPMRLMSSNLIRHTVLLTLYFSAAAILFLAENLTRLGTAVWLERSHFILIALLYSAWIVGLSKRGEASETWPELAPEVQNLISERNEFVRALGHHARK